MEKLIPPLVGILIVLAMLALTGCQQFEDRGIGISFGAKLEDSKVWLGFGITKHPALAEREVLEGEPPYEIQTIATK